VSFSLYQKLKVLSNIAAALKGGVLRRFLIKIICSMMNYENLTKYLQIVILRKINNETVDAEITAKNACTENPRC
jgi:hypothetical protein